MVQTFSAPAQNERKIQQIDFAFNKNGVKSISPNERITLSQLIKIIQNGHTQYAHYQYSTIAAMAADLYENGILAEKERLNFAKSTFLPYLIPAGFKNIGHGQKDLIFNGCVQIDLDFHFQQGRIKAQELKKKIKALNIPSLSICATSPTKYGLKLIFKTNLIEADADLYKFAQNQIFEYLNAILNVERSAFDSVPMAQTCYLPFDLDLIFNLEPTDFEIDLTNYTPQREIKREARNLEFDSFVKTDALNAVKFLIENEVNVTDNYFDWVKILGAISFEFGTDGEDIARNLSQISAKFNEKSFTQTFNSILKSEPKRPATGSFLIELATQNGFIAPPQTLPTENKRLSDYLPTDGDLCVVSRENALKIVAKTQGKIIIICEETFKEAAKKEIQTAEVLSYAHSSIINGTGLNVFVFGSQNLTRGSHYLNSLNTIQKVAEGNKIIYFSDTEIYLPTAKRAVLIDVPKLNIEIIESEKPNATFCQLLKSDENGIYLDTEESVKKQLQNECINRSELYATDKEKTLYVLYNLQCALTPEFFAGFKQVVFVVNSEAKKQITMNIFKSDTKKFTFNFLDSVQTETFGLDTEKIFTETIKNKKLAVRKENGSWVECKNTASALEFEHLTKVLANDLTALKNHIERLNGRLNINAPAVITEVTEQINEDIKEAKKDLKAEKKKEFFEFLDDAKNENIINLSSLISFVSKIENMTRGAKIAYTRIKTLCKVNNEFVTCVGAVHSSYTNWTQTKGRFYAAKTITFSTKKAKNLQIFRDTTDGQFLNKIDLIELAKKLNLVNGSESEAWRQLKRICYFTQRRVGREKERVRLYEAIFLDS